MEDLRYIRVELDRPGLALVIGDFARAGISLEWRIYVSVDPQTPERIAVCASFAIVSVYNRWKASLTLDRKQLVLAACSSSRW